MTEPQRAGVPRAGVPRAGVPRAGVPRAGVPAADTGPLRSPQEDGVCCCLCGSGDHRLVHQWEVGHRRNPSTIPLGAWQCGCRLVRLHPVPRADQLPDQGDWWAAGRKDIFRWPVYKRIRRAVQDAIFGGFVERFARQTRRAKTGGRLLDVGCGRGEFLELMSPYYECAGLEPSPLGARETRARGFKVIQAMLEDAELPAEHYDVATLDSVIEHVYDPVEVLARLNRMLKPGGVVALKTPKYGGLSCRLHGREWNGFRVGYHTFLFTGALLARCMEKAGFEVLRRPRRDRPLDDILILWGRKVRDAHSLPLPLKRSA